MAVSAGQIEQPLGIRDLHRRVNVAIARELRGQVWVRAEIAEMAERNSACFLTLAEPARDRDEGDAALDVVIWKQWWSVIRRQLEDRGLALRKGMTVTLRGDLLLRPGLGRLQLRGKALDTDALLGELAARRLALRRALAGEGLLDANRTRPLAPVPLRVGLVASRHSQGYRDFCDVLQASGYRFVLVEHPVLVQGLAAPTEVANAVGALGARGVDVIVVVRGGGARADLDAFDSEVVARAIAGAPVPVWTGVGHTGDRCVADDVCHTSHATPTACAQALVSAVDAFDRALTERARRLLELGGRVGSAAAEQLDVRKRLLTRSAAADLDGHALAAAARAGNVQRSAGRALTATATALAESAACLPRLAAVVLDDRAGRLHQQAARVVRDTTYGLDRSDDRLRTAARQVRACASRAGTAAGEHLGERVRRLQREGHRAVVEKEHEVAAQRRVLGAFDPTRQLERGWTLTLDERGALVRRAWELTAGQRITSRFVDGDRTSTVDGDGDGDRMSVVDDVAS